MTINELRSLTDEDFKRIENACSSFRTRLPNSVELQDLVNHSVLLSLQSPKNDLNPKHLAQQAFRQITGDGTVGRSNDNPFKATGPRSNTQSLTLEPLDWRDEEELTDAFIDLGSAKADFLKAYATHGDDPEKEFDLNILKRKAGLEGFELDFAYKQVTSELRRLLAE